MELISKLKEDIQNYCEYRISLGLTKKVTMTYLSQFDRYNYQNGNLDYLNKELTEAWITKKMEKQKCYSFICTIRGFSKYLSRYKTTYVVSDKFKIKIAPKPEVYLFTNKEIKSFFNECDNNIYLPSNKKIVFKALFRLLYFCGVRCCEARLLKTDYVNLSEGYLDIVNTKNSIDRRLFINDEFKSVLTSYDKQIKKSLPNREYFFAFEFDKELSPQHISETFNLLWDKAGLRKETRVRPRAYDFRHHFACQNILNWYDQGKNIHAMLPYLMTYMGHKSLETTYYYIHLIPDFFPKYEKIFKESENLIPEVEDYEI